MYGCSPYDTLATEEFILNKLKEGERVLFLYSHPKAVIIGRNQNAWTECRVSELEKDKGELARRISGGGAVYHDLGNLNFSFILNRNDYDLTRQQKVLCDAVKSLGIDARISGRNDILADGKKFSGNAFCFKRGAAFHHGTILINTDLTNLAKYLTVSPQKIRSKGINSVKSRVVNLSELNSAVTFEQTAQALKNVFQSDYNAASPYVLEGGAEKRINKLKERNSSWQWKFGSSPKFDITFENRFEWGGAEIKLSLKDGVIKECVIYSDAMDADLILGFGESLIGVPYSIEAIKNALIYNAENSANDNGKEIALDLINFLTEQNIQ